MSDENSSDSQEYKESYYHEEEEEEGAQVEDDVEEHRDKVPKYEYGFQGEDAEELHYEWVADDEKEEEEDGETAGKEKDGKKHRRVVIKVPDPDPKPPKKPDESPEEQGRRKTIYELDSYASLAALTQSLQSGIDSDQSKKKKKKLKRISESMGIKDVARVNLSPLTQKIVGCVIDENVTTEFPWIYVKKEIIEDDVDLHSESSDFLPIKSEIEQYQADKVLIGYAPKARVSEDEDEGQFHVCLTEEGRDAVVRRIEAQRAEQQDRVRTAVEKRAGLWNSQGSEDLVDLASLRKARPLFEIEVETTINQLKAPLKLTDRAVDDQRDGYVEIVPHREVFDNVGKVLVDRESKAVPQMKENESQTVMAHLVNSACQCTLDQEIGGEAPNLSKPQVSKRLKKFMESCVDDVVKEIVTNTTWDVYANDYAKLRWEAEADGSAPLMATPEVVYEERQSHYDGKLCRGRVINDLSWHPQWTGVAAAAYTATGRGENLVGPKPREEITDEAVNVLVWSFDDSLRPKLMLESKREVTAVSFCPYDGNVVVGGCRNGQIVIWDITGKIEEVERIVVQTAAEARNASVMSSLSTWMREPSPPWLVRPTATSSLQHSPRGAITSIDWLAPYHQINDRGRVQVDEHMGGLQVVTASLDGSIAFWDLNWRPPEDKKEDSRPTRRRKKEVAKPQSLAQSISAYKALDGLFKPLYMVIVQQAGEPSSSRNAVLTAASLRGPPMRAEMLAGETKEAEEDDLAKRKCYRMVVERPEEELVPDRIFVCTARGECGLISWEGYDFSTGVTLNKEIGKWSWTKQVHDGPVSHAVRSRFVKDVILTVGGHVFAIWREDFSEPIMWRKCEFRYTACCWGAVKPSALVLGRSDGTVEIWDIFIKSHEASLTQSLSGRVITGIYAHTLPLNPQCVGFCDYNGALRIFRAPCIMPGIENLRWMRRFIDREVVRIKDFIVWQKKWKELNAKEEESKSEDVAKKQEEAENKMKEELKQEAAKLEAARATKAKQRKQLLEQMRARWVTHELERMQRAILTKKGLKEEELERRREPVLKMEREAREKEQRKQRALDGADAMFEDVVATNFPHQKQKLLKVHTLPAAGQRVYGSYERDAVGDHITEEQKIVYEFEELEREALSAVRRHSHEPHFCWRDLIDEGIRRRRTLDVDLHSHKIKVDTDDEESTEPRISGHNSPPLGSLESFE